MSTTTRGSSIRPWIIGLLMAATSVAAWKLTPHILLADQQPALKLEAIVPTQFGEWKALEHADVTIPNPQQEKVIRSIYTETLSRVYVNAKGEAVMLSMAYGRDQSDGTAVHYPEVCYPAQGFTVNRTEILPLPIADRTIRVKRLLTSQGDRVEPLTYWTTVGTKTVLSGMAYKLAQFDYGFKGLIPDGMIVRASSIGNDADGQYQLQQRFLTDLVRAVPDTYRNRVAGAVGG